MLIYKHSHDSNMISAEKVSVYSKSHPLLAANPNPFTGNVKITMSGLATSSGQMNIYNAQGKLVRSIHVQNQSAVWDGRNNECVRLPEGTYMGVFTSGSFKLSIRLCLMH
ncbi:MAG: T9SS type A sorting domain-containing protein [Fibrobacteres bacterium]|nr:T9SS type A sorting domain-containing protein [Fibrobacterota bacterium]